MHVGFYLQYSIYSIGRVFGPKGLVIYLWYTLSFRPQDILCTWIYLDYTVPNIGSMYSQKMKLRGLVPNFYIHVSVSDLYTDRGNTVYKSLTDT